MMNCLFPSFAAASLVKDFVLPLATFFLSVAVALVAWAQWRVARNKLRLDLFDRRYKVYDATRTFLLLAINNAVTDSAYHSFRLATSDADFLFEPEVGKYLEEIRRCDNQLRTTRKLLESLESGRNHLHSAQDRQAADEELKRRTESQENDLLSLGAQAGEITKVFAPYLGFAHIK
jgi:hypothetical protein